MLVNNLKISNSQVKMMFRWCLGVKDVLLLRKMASVERTTFEIQGPVPNTNEDMIRTEWDFFWALIDKIQDFITNNHQHRIRLSPSLLVRLIVTTSFIIYLFIAQLALNVGDLDIKTIDIQDMYVNINIIDNNTISLESNTSLRVIFQKIGDIQPSPDLATFILALNTSSDHPASVTSNSKFLISENGHLTVVKFESHQTHLPEEEIRLLQKTLEEGRLWMMLNMDFKWHLKKGRLLVFPHPPRHIHFGCDIPYKNLPIDDKHIYTCIYER